MLGRDWMEGGISVLREEALAREIGGSVSRSRFGEWLFLSVVLIGLLFLVRMSPWWWIAVAFVVFHMVTRLWLHYSVPWRRVHFHAVQVYAGAAGLETGAADMQGREFDLRTALLLTVIGCRPEWPLSKCGEFMDREAARYARFSDRSDLAQALRRRYPRMPADKIDSVLDVMQKEFERDTKSLPMRQFVIAGLIEERYGAIARADYLLVAFTTKLAF
jgi:hypothetical protein